MNTLKAEKEINKVKSNLVNRYKKIGIWENFGEKEIDNLKSKLNVNPYGSRDERNVALMIQELEQWAFNFVG